MSYIEWAAASANSTVSVIYIFMYLEIMYPNIITCPKFTKSNISAS